MNTAIVLASGTGTIVEANIPKQFVEVQGKPILAYTLDNFQNDPETVMRSYTIKIMLMKSNLYAKI